MYCAIDVGFLTCGYVYSSGGKDFVSTNFAKDEGFESKTAPSALLYDENKHPMYFGYDAIRRFTQMSPEERAKHIFSYNGVLQSHLFNLTSSLPEEKEKIWEEMTHLVMLLANHFKENYYSPNTKRKSNCDSISWIVLICQFDEKIDKYKADIRKVFTDKFQTDITILTRLEIIPKLPAVLLKHNIKTSYTQEEENNKALLVECGDAETVISLVSSKNDPCLNFTDGYIDIQNEIIKRFEETFGAKFVSMCRENYPWVWLDIILELQRAEKEVKVDKFVDINISLNSRFIKAYEAITNQSWDDKASESASDEITLSNTGELCISSGIIEKVVAKYESKLQKSIHTSLKSGDYGINSIEEPMVIYIGDVHHYCLCILQKMMEGEGSGNILYIPHECELIWLKCGILQKIESQKVNKRKSKLEKKTSRINGDQSDSKSSHGIEEKNSL